MEKLRTPNLLGLESQEFDFPYPKQVSKEKEKEKEPNIRGYNLLSMPSPSPNSNLIYNLLLTFVKDQTPMMTWGEVEGTPVVLDRRRGFRVKNSLNTEFNY